MFKKLQEQLDIRDEGDIKKFLGFVVTREQNGDYHISQRHYIQEKAVEFAIQEHEMHDTPGKPKSNLEPIGDREMTEEEKKLPFQELVGSLLFACKTRYDIRFAVSDVSRFMSKWNEEHYLAARRILGYLCKHKSNGLTMTNNATPTHMELVVYCDANYGDDREDAIENAKWKSQGGHLVFVGGSLVGAVSRRQKLCTLSSMEAEYVEASEAAKSIRWYRRFLEELGYPQKQPTTLLEDNKACIDFCNTSIPHDRTKHIDIRAHALKENVSQGIICIQHINTEAQLADFLTKHIPDKQFHRFVSVISLGQLDFKRNEDGTLYCKALNDYDYHLCAHKK
jgi:hypothetical protein